MIRRANKRAQLKVKRREGREKKGGEMIFFQRSHERGLRSETLPVEVLECALSRDTGLTGKEGWESVFPSHELHNKPRSFFFSFLLSIFFSVLPVWLGLWARSPHGRLLLAGLERWGRDAGGSVLQCDWSELLNQEVVRQKQGKGEPPWGYPAV